MAPVAQDRSASTLEDTSVGVTLLAEDADIPAQGLTYSIVAQPAHGSVTVVDGVATYTPAVISRPDSFTYKANDGTVDSNTATVSITITPVNDPPEATPRTASTSEETPVILSFREPTWKAVR